MGNVFAFLHAVPDLVTSVWVASHVMIGDGALKLTCALVAVAMSRVELSDENDDIVLSFSRLYPHRPSSLMLEVIEKHLGKLARLAVDQVPALPPWEETVGNFQQRFGDHVSCFRGGTDPGSQCA